MHITMMDLETHFYGGYLEEGCDVLTLSEFSILHISDIRLRRRRIPERSIYSLLDREIRKKTGGLSA